MDRLLKNKCKIKKSGSEMNAHPDNLGKIN
jgi:hypothetical protein